MSEYGGGCRPTCAFCELGHPVSIPSIQGMTYEKRTCCFIPSATRRYLRSSHIFCVETWRRISYYPRFITVTDLYNMYVGARQMSPLLYVVDNVLGQGFVVFVKHKKAGKQTNIDQWKPYRPN